MQFRLDKTAFKMRAVQEADDQYKIYASMTPHERWETGWFLVCVAYRWPEDQIMYLDRTAFHMGKQSKQE
ncbi:MAG: hypothetical protein KDB85_07810 [Chitinophagales bacterium]|nr:hypothetical protein [Chitinophagales bacterium]